MPNFMVLKRVGDGGRAEDWQATMIAMAEDEAGAAVQGYTGEGRYKAVEWPEAEGSEFDLGQGPPAATPVTGEGS